MPMRRVGIPQEFLQVCARRDRVKASLLLASTREGRKEKTLCRGIGPGVPVRLRPNRADGDQPRRSIGGRGGSGAVRGRPRRWALSQDPNAHGSCQKGTRHRVEGTLRRTPAGAGEATRITSRGAGPSSPLPTVSRAHEGTCLSLARPRATGAPAHPPRGRSTPQRLAARCRPVLHSPFSGAPGPLAYQ
jgi:hypothetical protein